MALSRRARLKRYAALEARSALPRGAPPRSSVPLKRTGRIAPVSDRRQAEVDQRAEVRRRVFDRDHHCLLVGMPGAGHCYGRPTPHHILKASQGGRYDMQTLVRLCQHHNDWIETHDGQDLAAAWGLWCRRGDTLEACWLRLRTYGLVTYDWTGVPLMSMMTKSDRQQLQTLVRRRFKALRGEVAQRKMEMHAELHAEIADRYRDEDARFTAARNRAQEIVDAANREINDVFRELEGARHDEQLYVHGDFYPGRRSVIHSQRGQLSRAATARIEALGAEALTKLERQEVALLERLIVDGLETETARQFLETIPTVGELVPATRLAELEASIEASDG